MMNSLQNEPCAIIMLGTYGSGFSAVAGVLHRLGVMMGTRLVPPSKENPKGYFEDMHFRTLLYKFRKDKSVIFQLIAFIEGRYNNFDIWGVKEPAIIEAIADLGPSLSQKNYKIITTNRHPWPMREVI